MGVVSSGINSCNRVLTNTSNFTFSIISISSSRTRQKQYQQWYWQQHSCPHQLLPLLRCCRIASASSLVLVSADPLSSRVDNVLESLLVLIFALALVLGVRIYMGSSGSGGISSIIRASTSVTCSQGLQVARVASASSLVLVCNLRWFQYSQLQWR